MNGLRVASGAPKKPVMMLNGCPSASSVPSAARLPFQSSQRISNALDAATPPFANPAAISSTISAGNSQPEIFAKPLFGGTSAISLTSFGAVPFWSFSM